MLFTETCCLNLKITETYLFTAVVWYFSFPKQCDKPNIEKCQNTENYLHLNGLMLYKALANKLCTILKYFLIKYFIKLFHRIHFYLNMYNTKFEHESFLIEFKGV